MPRTNLLILRCEDAKHPSLEGRASRMQAWLFLPTLTPSQRGGDAPPGQRQVADAGAQGPRHSVADSRPGRSLRHLAEAEGAIMG